MGKFLQIPTSWETANAKIARALKTEDFATWLGKTPKYEKRGFKINPGYDNVIRVLTFPEVNQTSSGKVDLIKEFAYSHNLITDQGKEHYAKMACGEAPSANEDFHDGANAEFVLRSASDTPAAADTYTDIASPIAASQQGYSASYPQTVDTDADNTGDGVNVVSYATLWSQASFSNSTIQGGAIYDHATPGAGTQLLTHFNLTSFEKTTNDTLKLFVNHTMS